MKNIVIGAIVFSIWFVTLFFEKSIGLSMLLYVLPLICFIIYILKNNGKQQNLKSKSLIIPIIILASTYFIYNNSFFRGINIIAILGLLGIMILEILKQNALIDFSCIGKILYIFLNPLNYIDESLKKASEYFKEKISINISNENKEKTKKIIKALSVTIPLVLIILVLLSSADDIFGNIFENIFIEIAVWFENLISESLVARIVVTICVFIYLISLFYSICFTYENETENKIKKIENIDNFTIKMILACLNVIYLVFCAIQIQSLFLKNVNINYADYARKGFFQLMAVSIINLITIVIAKKSENIGDKKTNIYINSMSIIMVIFTFIILISAAIRMYNYETAYGYTLLRLLVYCALFTEGVLLVPTSLYILNVKIKLFQTYFYIILVIYIGMNFMNFDNLIAKRNVDRYFETGKIDINYLVYNTRTDAVNQLARIVEKTSNSSKNKKSKFGTSSKKYNKEYNEKFVLENTEEYLKELYTDLENEKMDYRDFNLSKYFAKEKIKELNIDF